MAQFALAGPGDLEPPLLEFFQNWHKPTNGATPLHSLRLFAGVEAQDDAIKAYLRRQLERMLSNERDESEILQQRFIDELSAQVVANRKNISTGNTWHKQKLGIASLARTLFAEEQRVRADRQSTLLARLEPPTYGDLLGADGALRLLSDLLQQPDAGWLIAVEGMGGIGKTALADKLVRDQIAANQWEEVAWVTARQTVMNLGGGIKAVERPALTVEALVEQLTAQLLPHLSAQHGVSYEGRLQGLQKRLKATPHLLIIDNLETLTDVETLLSTLRTWVNPSRCLLTMRQRLLHEADLYHFLLSELNQTDAYTLLRREARGRNLPDLATATEAELRPIYQTVGGNPLALRLVVGQLHLYDLGHLLRELRQASGQPIRNLYDYLYRRAWEKLDEAARRTLLLMLLTTEQGKSFADLVLLGERQLTPADLRHGLDTLVALSLVDSRGGLHERRYTIHSLTRTFLHQAVLQF